MLGSCWYDASCLATLQSSALPSDGQCVYSVQVITAVILLNTVSIHNSYKPVLQASTIIALILPMNYTSVSFTKVRV